MNDNNQPRNHTPMVLVCVTILASQAAFMGAFLLWKGFSGGGELVVTLNTAISGLIGFLGGRATNQQQQPQDITVSTQPPKVELKQPLTTTADITHNTIGSDPEQPKETTV